MKDTWYEARRKVVTFARKLQAERLVYSTAGNISMRIPGDPELLAVTPTSMQYDLLAPEDIPIVDVNGELVDGRIRPTSELMMHTLICQRRPEIGSIVHTHGKAVMTMANLGWTLPPILTGLCEAACGAVHTSPYSQSETVQMADYTEPRCVTAGRRSCATTACWPTARTSSTPSTRPRSSRARARCTSRCASSARCTSFPPPSQWIASYWRAQFPGAPGPLPPPDPLPGPQSSLGTR